MANRSPAPARTGQQSVPMGHTRGRSWDRAGRTCRGKSVINDRLIAALIGVRDRRLDAATATTMRVPDCGVMGADHQRLPTFNVSLVRLSLTRVQRRRRPVRRARIRLRETPVFTESEPEKRTCRLVGPGELCGSADEDDGVPADNLAVQPLP